VLTDREKACLANDVADVLPSSVVITRASSASDGLGGRSNTFSAVGTYAARVTPADAGAVEQEIGSKMRDGMTYRVAFPAGTDVRIGDRLTFSGLTLSVEGVRSPRSIEVERVVYVTRANA
jgi:hypothetical protein